MLDFHEIKSGLMGLSRAELTEIKKTVSLLLERNTEVDPMVSMLFEVLQSGMTRNGLTCPGMVLYRKQKPELFNELCQHAEMLNTWMRGIGIIRVIDKKLLMLILLDLVVESIQASNTPLNMTTLIRYFASAPSRFDNSFPGYAANGMGMFLINSRRENYGKGNEDL